MIGESTRACDFPSLVGRTYLNTAAEGIPPPCVAEALAQYAADKQLGMDGRLRHEAQWNALRAAAGELFGLTADEIGICSCASEAFNLASLALRLREGDEVVITDLDFPAGATPWLQEICPATVKLWQARAGALCVEDLVPLLGPRTRLVTVSLVSFFNGFLLPLAQVVEAVRQHSDSLLAVDPLATGILPIALGEATKTIAWCQDATKTYRFQVAWGTATATDDAEGEIIARSQERPGRTAI